MIFVIENDKFNEGYGVYVDEEIINILSEIMSIDWPYREVGKKYKVTEKEAITMAEALDKAIAVFKEEWRRNIKKLKETKTLRFIVVNDIEKAAERFSERLHYFRELFSKGEFTVTPL